MTKDELIGIVKAINVNWPLTDVDVKTVYETWWRYLSDLEADQVQVIVDELIIESSPWRPKVGEIRRRVVDGAAGWPSPEAAWALAETCMAAANQGMAPPGLPDGVGSPLGECIKGARGNRVAFLELWKAKTAERYSIQKYD